MAYLLECHSWYRLCMWQAAVLWGTIKETHCIIIMNGGDNRICLLCRVKMWSMTPLIVTLLAAVLQKHAHHGQRLDITNTDKFISRNCSNSGLLIPVKSCLLPSTRSYRQIPCNGAPCMELVLLTILVPRILRWLMDFWKICEPLHYTQHPWHKTAQHCEVMECKFCV
jgi:hypothetical protein